MEYTFEAQAELTDSRLLTRFLAQPEGADSSFIGFLEGAIVGNKQGRPMEQWIIRTFNARYDADVHSSCASIVCVLDQLLKYWESTLVTIYKIVANKIYICLKRVTESSTWHLIPSFTYKNRQNVNLFVVLHFRLGVLFNVSQPWLNYLTPNEEKGGLIGATTQSDPFDYHNI